MPKSLGRYSTKALIALASTAIAVCPALADGFVDNGHASGAHTDLILTKEQILALNKPHNVKIKLTAEQKAILRKKMRKAERVDSIWVVPSNHVGCSCEANNAAVRVAPNKIEVVDWLLARDFERQRHTSFWGGGDYSFENTSENAPELAPYLESREARLKGDSAKSTELLEQSLKINPKFIPPHYYLAHAYIQLAQKQEKAGHYKQAKDLYDKAKAIAWPKDVTTQDTVADAYDRLKGKI
jgi:tetratricopeptide (TPR) repeat protein